MKLNELAIREPQHTMVFGDSKSGKSWLVSQLARNYKLIWISMDNGHRVLYELPAEAQANIDIIVTPDTRDFPVAMDTVRKLLKGDRCEVCHSHGKVSCTVCTASKSPTSVYEFSKLPLDTIVVLDHITQLTDSCMALICKGKDVDYKPKLDDWGSLRFNMLNIMTLIQQAPFNIVCISQAMESEMEDGKKKIVPQVGSREFGKSVGSFFDHIIYCSVLNSSHRAGSSTRYQASVLTGSRSSISIETLEFPTLIPFFDGTAKPKEGYGDKQAKDTVRQLTGTAPVVTDLGSGASSNGSSSLAGSKPLSAAAQALLLKAKGQLAK